MNERSATEPVADQDSEGSPARGAQGGLLRRFAGYFRGRRPQAVPETTEDTLSVRRVDPGLQAMEATITVKEAEGEADMKWRKTRSQSELGLDKLNRLRNEGKLAKNEEVPEPAPRSVGRPEPISRREQEAGPTKRPAEEPREPAPRRAPARKASRAGAPDVPQHSEPLPMEGMPAHLARTGAEDVPRRSRLRGGHVKPFRPKRSEEPVEDVEIPVNQHLASQIADLSDVHVELQLPEISATELVTGAAPHIPAQQIAVREARNSPLTIHSPLMRKTLRKHKLSTIGDLLKHSEEELLSLKGIGPATVDLLKKQLRKHGLKLPKPGEVAEPDQEEATLFSDGPMSRLDDAEQVLTDGRGEEGLAALLCLVEDHLIGFVRQTEPGWGRSSPIRVLRKLFREGQLGKEQYERMLEVVHLCSLSNSGREISNTKARQAFKITRACLEALTAVPALN